MARKTLVQQLAEVIELCGTHLHGDDPAVRTTAQAIVDAGWRPARSATPDPGLDREYVARSLEAHADTLRAGAVFYYDRLVADIVRNLADDIRGGRVVLDGEAEPEGGF